MKKLLIAFALALVALPAHATTFKSVKEVYPGPGLTFVLGWNYEFYFSSPAGAPGAVVHAHRDRCERPRTPDGRLLAPLEKTCFSTEAEARVDAKKEVDIYEKQARARGVSTAAISATHQVKKVTGQ